MLKRTDRGDLIKAQIFLKPPIITTMSNSRKASLQQVIENWMTTVLGFLKSGKLRSRRTFDQGDLIKLLAEWYDKFALIMDKILLDGTTQSVRYGEVLRDRSGRLGDINSRVEARAQSFVIGNDETELELSVESRSFVNRVNDQVRKRKKNNFQCYRKWRRTFYDLVNVYGCDNGMSDIHGKEFTRESEFHCEYYRSHTEENVRHISKIGDRTR